MSDQSQKVKVKLHGSCYVENVIRKPGEVVEIARSVAEAFGTLVKAEKPETDKPEPKPADADKSK